MFCFLALARALVVVKAQIVERAFAELGMKLRRSTRSSVKVSAGGAWEAGRAAGAQASFGKPVNGGGAVAQIEGGGR